MAKTREDWLLAGLTVLAQSGKIALKVERLCQELQVTKGSFYHHFSSLQDYETSLLDFYEQVTTLDIIKGLEHISDPRDRIRALIEHTNPYEPHLEIALRTWARQDEKAATLQRKLDQTREHYVAQLAMEIVPDAQRAKQLARAFYWMFVGSQQVFMHHDPQEKLQIHLLMLDQLGL